MRLLGVFQDGDGGPALKGLGEFIEPPDLAPGEPAGAGGDLVFGLIQRHLSGQVLQQLTHAHGIQHGRVYLLPASSMALRVSASPMPLWAILRDRPEIAASRTSLGGRR